MRYRFILMLFALLAMAPVIGQNSSNAKRVAILETVDKEDQVSYGVKLMVRSKLSEVITATPGYEGYDRVDITSIMSEHDFQRTGLVSDADIKKLGEMTGAEYILIAEVAYLNSSNIFLSAKILNVETARIERTASIQTESTVDELYENCRLLAGKLLNVNVETGAVRGELIMDDGRYVGECKDSLPHGKGTIYYAPNDEYDRKYYEGEWSEGVKHGTGTMVWNDGDKYVGNWKDDTRYGQGSMYYASGHKYVGNWKDGKQHGEGTYYWTDDTYEVGYYKDGVQSGPASYYKDGKRSMNGYYKNGVKDGKWYRNGGYTIYDMGQKKRTVNY